MTRFLFVPDVNFTQFNYVLHRIEIKYILYKYTSNRSGQASVTRSFDALRTLNNSCSITVLHYFTLELDI